MVVMAPGDMTANTPVDCMLEDSDIEMTQLYVTPGQLLPALPDHDLIFVAVGESDGARLYCGSLSALPARRQNRFSTPPTRFGS